MISYWKPPKEVSRGWLATRRNLWLRRRRLRIFAIPTHANVLDVGCGDGLNLSLMHEMGTTHLTGIDRSKIAIDRAKKNVPSAHLIMGDAWKLPFQNNVFDTVLVDSVFHILSLSPEPLAQIYRILVPGGHLCFIEPHDTLYRKVFDRLTVSPLSYAFPFLQKRRVVYEKEKPLLDRWFGYETQFLKDLVNAGFRKIFVQYDVLSIVGKFQKL